MPDSIARQAKAATARIYVTGVLAFVAIFGGLSLAVLFFQHLKV